MNKPLSIPKINYLFSDETVDEISQKVFDDLAENKISWEDFLKKIEDPKKVSRMTCNLNGRSLLHLSVLDNRLEIVRMMSKEGVLKLKRDSYGLTALDLAQFLGRKECQEILQPGQKSNPTPMIPKGLTFEYLCTPIFETKDGLEQTLAHVSKVKKEDRIPPEKIWMGIYFDKEIQKGIHPPVTINLIDQEVGYGVFTEKKIPPCSYVGEYTGIIQERKHKELKDKKYCLRYNIWEGKKTFTIDAEERGNFTRFMNHSSTPNLVVQSIYWRGIPRMIFVSLVEIQIGSQLTFDYGPIFWKESLHPPKSFNDH